MSAAMGTVSKPPSLWQRFGWWRESRRKFDPDKSNLVKHARRELDMWTGAGSKDDLYGDMLIKAVLELVEVFAKQGHSGMSASVTLHLFGKVADFKALMPLTNNPEEWNEVGPSTWQNARQSNAFSEDGGLTYHVLGDKDESGEYVIHTAEAVA